MAFTPCWVAEIDSAPGSSVGVPAALAPSGVSVSHPKARLDGHARDLYPVRRARCSRRLI